MNGAFLILQKRTPLHSPLGHQSDYWHAGMIPDVSLTIALTYLNGFHLQLPRNLIQIVGRKQNIFPVNAAFAALGAVELECVVQRYGHLINMIRNFL